MPGPTVLVGDKDDKGGNAITGSPNVFANGLPVVRVGDGWEGTKGAYMSATGSPNVFVNDRPRCSVGDQTDFPSTMLASVVARDVLTN